jgi:signal transduction histidine kinase
VRRTIHGLPAADVALAFAFFAAKLVSLAAGIQPGGGLVSYIALPFWTLPLAWRSREPTAVAVVIGCTAVLETAIGGYHDSLIALLILVLVPYSIGAHHKSTRDLVPGFGFFAAAGLTEGVLQGAGGIGNFMAICALLGGSLMAGLWVRQLRLRAETLERLAADRERAAVAEERARIARELHDEVAHAMSVIAVQADAAEGALAHDASLVQPPLVAIRDTARSALADMRRVVGALRADDEAIPHAPEPGLARIGTLLDHARAAGLGVEVRVEGDRAPLPPAVDVAAYRVLQEGLTNVRKHANARHAEVVLHYGPEELALAVIDDGDGSGAGGGSGHGLTGIRERVSLLGGEVHARSEPHGFALRATLPLR